MSCQVRDDLIGFTKVDLLKTLLEDCFRAKLRGDYERVTRALVLLIPLLTLGSKSTSLKCWFSFVSPGCTIPLVFCCVLSSWS